MFEETMREFKDKYWVLKGEDGVWALGNHAFYLQTKKQIKQTKPIVTITPFSVKEPVEYFQLLAINVAQPKSYLNKLLDSGLPTCGVRHGKFDFESGQYWQMFDDGFSFVFHKSHLDQVCDIYNLKKKAKRKPISDEAKIELAERLKIARDSKTKI